MINIALEKRTNLMYFYSFGRYYFEKKTGLRRLVKKLEGTYQGQ